MKGIGYLLPLVPAAALILWLLLSSATGAGPGWEISGWVLAVVWAVLIGVLLGLVAVAALGILWGRRSGALDRWRAERHAHRTGMLGGVIANALHHDRIPPIRGRIASRNDRSSDLARCEMALIEACDSLLQLKASVARLRRDGTASILLTDTLAIVERAVVSLSASGDRLGAFSRHELSPSERLADRLTGERERLEQLNAAIVECQHGLAELVLATESDLADVSDRFSAVRIAANTLAEWRGA